MMLRIYDGLDVVADGAGFLATAGHGARIRVGKRQLSVRFFLQLLFDLLALTHPLSQQRDFIMQAHGLQIETYRAGPVC
ncbi:hypothetical protein AWB78_08165 [Caballeronia calidae]|uniref:Uncharacterized protein n=1 Tax=Caballeronia calidae TaxID=1777139 RepID=A0A158EIH5_9BURK|nr:hypothetical protein AWB78_08165 [Caballeronia calidae]